MECKGLVSYPCPAALPGLPRLTIDSTAEKQAIYPGWPTRPGHGHRSDDGMAANAHIARWEMTAGTTMLPCQHVLCTPSSPSTITLLPAAMVGCSGLSDCLLLGLKR
jgi:hypothetical protein